MTSHSAEACAVTGASGYVGSILVEALRGRMPVVEMMRHPKSETGARWSLESGAAAGEILRKNSVTTLIHAAWDMRASSLRGMEETCVRGSAALFDAARRAGVKRIVFISTFSAFDGCRSAYGRTKLAVEKMLEGEAGVVFRPGHVFGSKPGGVFGNILRQVRSGTILPVIGTGAAPQYLLHEKTLSESIARAVSGDFDSTRGAPIALAHPRPWPFRDLLQSIAASEHRKVTLVPVPWPLLFGGLRAAEALGLNLPFRSDSVISFVHYNRAPDFDFPASLGIDPIPWTPAPGPQPDSTLTDV